MRRLNQHELELAHFPPETPTEIFDRAPAPDPSMDHRRLLVELHPPLQEVQHHLFEGAGHPSLLARVSALVLDCRRWAGPLVATWLPDRHLSYDPLGSSACSALFVEALQKQKNCLTVNLGTGQAHSIRTVIAAVAARLENICRYTFAITMLIKLSGL
jgi:hypothetical protein